MDTQLEIARAMTSISPPTNPRILDRWVETVTDEDLRKLISDWKKFAVTGEYRSSLECYDSHQAVTRKISEGFFGKPDPTWVCNQCGLENFTGSVNELEIESELHACIGCGGFEFHREN